MRLIETDTNANKDINAAVSVGAYTATATRGVIVRLLADQVAGGGDYIAYVTVQLAGAGSHYRIIPLTTGTAAAALTAIGFVSIPVPVDTGDVLTVYIDGLAGDTTTPDVRVDFYEQDYLRPTVTGRTLDVAATGEAGIDLTNKLDTAGILPTVAAGAENGLPILSAALATSANVTQVKGATISDLDASGNVLAKLANTVTHGGSTAQLALKKITVANSDNQGVAFSLRGGNPISPGIAIELIRGDGSSGAGRIGGYIDGVNNGVSLATEAIHDINFDVTGLQAIADAGLLAPTPGTPADGSVYDLLADASSGLTAQQTADAVNNLAPASTGATGSIRAKLDAIKLITDAIDTSAVTVTASNDAGVLTLIQAVTFNATVSGLTISGTWAKLYFTLKWSEYDDDDAAIVQLVASNPAAPLTDGLLYLDGAAVASPLTFANGTLTVSQAAGTVAIAITDNATALLAKASGLVWDIKTKDAAGATVQNTTGTASIMRAVTQTI